MRMARWPGLAAVATGIMLLSAGALKALQFVSVPIVSATEIPQSALIQPAQLNADLQKKTGETPLILQVGSNMMFSQGHIPGAEFAGPAVQPEGIALLRNRVASLPRGKYIVLYCGCCPWTRCPNMGTAYRFLLGMGFKNVKTLYLPNNFGQDWVSQGYRVEK
jgi:thiosulfate/3-mercaptopyruvate sulfurtransferase